jgi:hypothetical protein
MIFETDVTAIAYTVAWNAQRHRKCTRIVLMETALGLRKPPRWTRITRADDYEIEALAQGVAVKELLR